MINIKIPKRFMVTSIGKGWLALEVVRRWGAHQVSRPTWHIHEGTGANARPSLIQLAVA
jgi:hypothetical protein